MISPMGVNGIVPFEGISVSVSREKADSNCLLQILALSRVSVFKIPFSLKFLLSDTIRSSYEASNLSLKDKKNEYGFSLNFSVVYVLIFICIYVILVISHLVLIDASWLLLTIHI